MRFLAEQKSWIAAAFCFLILIAVFLSISTHTQKTAIALQCQYAMGLKKHTKESKTYFKFEYAAALHVDRGKQHQSSAELCLL